MNNEARATPSTDAVKRLGLVDRYKEYLFAPVSIMPLVYLRVLFGTFILIEIIRYFEKGWITQFYISPPINYTYSLTPWVQPWSGEGMFLHFYLLAFFAFFIIVGLGYRLFSLLFCLGFTYLFLLEKALYLNHFYMICLLSLLMVFTPANRAFSLDNLVKKRPPLALVPNWSLWLIKFQVGVVYFFGGVAKFESDWLYGEPMREILYSQRDRAVIGPLLNNEFTTYMMSYTGLLYDLLVFPMLLHKKLRWVALAASIVFHLTNAMIFPIGIFPWLMLALSFILFFEDKLPTPEFFKQNETKQVKKPVSISSGSKYNRAIIAFASLYMFIQLVLPFRYLCYGTQPLWSTNGLDFSWRMMLKIKKVKKPVFTASYTDKTGQVHKTPVPFPNADRLWTAHWQFKDMGTDPDMILQFVHYYAKTLEEQGLTDIKITAKMPVSLNSRPPQLLIDPTVDLTTEKRHYLHRYDWVLPLTTPLPSRD